MLFIAGLIGGGIVAVIERAFAGHWPHDWNLQFWLLIAASILLDAQAYFEEILESAENLKGQIRDLAKEIENVKVQVTTLDRHLEQLRIKHDLSAELTKIRNSRK